MSATPVLGGQPASALREQEACSPGFALAAVAVLGCLELVPFTVPHCLGASWDRDQ